jgi:hypothetical protein
MRVRHVAMPSQTPTSAPVPTHDSLARDAIDRARVKPRRDEAVNGGLVIAMAVGASAGLFALWSWEMHRLEAREYRREAERCAARNPLCWAARPGIADGKAKGDDGPGKP